MLVHRFYLDPNVDQPGSQKKLYLGLKKKIEQTELPEIGENDLGYRQYQR